MKNRPLNHPTIPPWAVAVLLLLAAATPSQSATIKSLSNYTIIEGATTGTTVWFELPRGVNACKVYGAFTGSPSVNLEVLIPDSVGTVELASEFTSVTSKTGWLPLDVGVFKFRLNVTGGTSPSINLACTLIER